MLTLNGCAREASRDASRGCHFGQTNPTEHESAADRILAKRTQGRHIGRPFRHSPDMNLL